jgi:putative GTP pyrophosphokinase
LTPHTHHIVKGGEIADSSGEAGAPDTRFSCTVEPGDSCDWGWLDAICLDRYESDGPMNKPASEYPPWGSKGAVNRAGEALRGIGPLSAENAAALENWRASHNAVLNTFQAILRNRTRGKGIVVAQRLKRRNTIIDKLSRESKMQLARMDDVAGCRLIFADVAELRDFRANLLQAKFAHKRKNEVGKYDYILTPKPSGYRGVHDIYEYNVSSKQGARFKGLMLELQYRTKSQHAWATAVEVVTQMTDFQPKFNRGGEAGIIFFQFASEIMARTLEGGTSCFPHMTDRQVVKGFEKADKETQMMRFLYSLNVLHDYSEGGHLVLQYENNGGLKIHNFDKVSSATKALFQLEKDHPQDNVVLVQADTFEQIRSAYRNYFSDATEFLVAMESGTISLSGVLTNVQK